MWTKEDYVQRPQNGRRGAGQVHGHRSQGFLGEQDEGHVARQTKICKGEGSGEGTLKSEEGLAQGEEARTGMGRAMQVAACRETLGEAVEKLKGNFWAASSKGARDVERYWPRESTGATWICFR